MLEEIDARIANELAADGRCSYTDLAERVGLSVSAVHQRVRRLEQRGVITGYAARIGGEQIGLPLTAFVSLTPIDPAAPDDYPQRLSHLARSRPATRSPGVESYILRVRVASPARWSRCWPRSAAPPRYPPRRRWCCPRPYEDRPPLIAAETGRLSRQPVR